MYEHLGCTIEGLPPGMLMHNGRLANPLDPLVKELKQYTAKRKKTDSDLEAMIKLEWYGGLYFDEEQRVIVPTEWLEGMLVEAAKKQRLGRDFRAGLMVPESPRLEYDGPKDVDQLWASGRHIDTRKSTVNGRAVMRTRAHFPDWRLSFRIAYLPNVVNAQAIIDALELASYRIGLSDYRPKFGRFTVLEVARE